MENITSNTQVHGYTLKGVLFLIGIIAILGSTNAQVLSSESKKAKKLYEKADKKYRDRDFYSALDLLEESVKEDPTFFEAYIRMGSLYKAIGKEDSVYSKFQSYIETSPDPIASVLEKQAFMAFDRGEYFKAKKYLNQFLDKVPERSENFDIDLLSRSLEFATDQLESSADSITVSLLPKEINRFRLQYLPSVTIDDASIFFTKRDDVRGDEDIVVSYKKEGKWLPAKSVSARINTPLNEGACTVSADGRTMIFTSCDGRNSLGSCDLYITNRVGDIWTQPKNLGKPVNSLYWESQPSLSADGKTLYFASNRRGGFGGRDIWVTKYEKDQWSVPENLGKTINTRKDETTPFIHPNGVSLYFSGNGYPGMGGYDLYQAQKKDSTWTEPKNLGYPINTYRDEVSIVIIGEGSKAYYAKEEQKNFEIMDSKLVAIQLPEELRSKGASYIIGVVKDARTGECLSADIQVVDLSSNASIYKNTSDSVSGQYYMVLPVDLDLAGYVKKKGYLYSDFHFKTDSNTALKPDTINIELIPVEEGETLILKNIYFEVDSHEINRRSQSEIENAYELLRENLGITVEIAGHTDDTGTKSYNQSLSDKRAKAVFDALVAKGIDKDRLVFKGYADSQPLQPNTSKNNRQSNRRIEFRVIRMKQ
ncbi:OmpA family protein [Ekhidna sp.]|uniref:OmpA family protein n=1 Tax=Ekhidna sp. TaxID=2608089 RepID=UPI003C7BE7A3